MELIRYIHLNPLRAKLVQDLKELDKYPWTGPPASRCEALRAGHSAILGYRKNPLVPEVRNQKSGDRNQSQRTPNQPGKPSSVNRCTSFAAGGLPFSLSSHQGVGPYGPESGKGKKKEDPSNLVNPVKKEKPLAGKTIEEVLLHFGETKKVARRRYRQFVKNAIEQGKRPEFQGGGLVRSAGGDRRGLLGRKKEERDPPDSPEAPDGGRGKGDARILGSGDFVVQALKQADELHERTIKPRISLDELIKRVSEDREIATEDLISSKRKKDISNTRAIISYLAAIELRYSGTKIASELRLSEKSVSRCIERGKKLVDNDKKLLEYLQ